MQTALPKKIRYNKDMIGNPLGNRLASLQNEVDFALRRLIRWQRPGFQERPEPKDNLFDDHPPEQQHWMSEWEKQAVDRYGLADLKARSTRLRYLECLTYLKHLEDLFRNTAVPAPAAERLRWLDAGAKNWSYVDALDAFGRFHAKSVSLHGVELDGYRVCRGFYSRADMAKAYSRFLPNAEYHVGDVGEHSGQYYIISCFLPFVFERPLLRWGLPLRYFAPETFLSRMAEQVLPGGALLLVNQGEAEAEKQKTLLEELAQNTPGEWEITEVGLLSPALCPAFKLPRYGWRCRKTDRL